MTSHLTAPPLARCLCKLQNTTHAIVMICNTSYTRCCALTHERYVQRLLLLSVDCIAHQSWHEHIQSGMIMPAFRLA